MAANWLILELVTSHFGSESMKYCFSKVLLEAKLLEQKFFCNLRQPDFDPAAPASSWLNCLYSNSYVKEPKIQNLYQGTVFHTIPSLYYSYSRMATIGLDGLQDFAWIE